MKNQLPQQTYKIVVKIDEKERTSFFSTDTNISDLDKTIKAHFNQLIGGNPLARMFSAPERIAKTFSKTNGVLKFGFHYRGVWVDYHCTKL